MALLKTIAAFLCGLMLVEEARSQVPNFGTCPKNIKVVQNFEASRYLGKWYENQKYFAFFEFGGKCISATYSATDKDDVVKVVNRQLNTFRNEATSIEGKATIVSKNGEAKLGVEFPTVPFNRLAPYWVIGTDYENYSVVYSCSDVGGFVNARIIWILTRERFPSTKVLEEAYEVLDANKLSRAGLIATDQSDCPADL